MRGDVAQAFGLVGFAPTGGGTTVTDTPLDVNYIIEAERRWEDQAACHPSHKPETMTLGAWVDQWFPHPTDPPDAALAICQACPVREQSLDAHLHEQAGIWGGTTGRQRSRLRRERGVPQRTKKRIDHGTQGGYRAHLRRGEDPCPACRHAHADAQVVRNARLRRLHPRPVGAAAREEVVVT